MRRAGASELTVLTSVKWPLAALMAYALTEPAFAP